MARQADKKRLFLLISSGLLAGSTVLGGLRLYSTATPQPTSAGETTESSFTEQIRGYEVVLQREPNNQTALEGLAIAHLQNQDVKAAIPLLEKLVKLNPDRSDYTALLAKAKQQTSH